MAKFMTECPGCGKQIELIPHATKAGRYVAYCGCQGSARSMIETCAPVPEPTKRPTRTKAKAAPE